VQLLQTSASVENVLVSAYDAVIGMPILSGKDANPALRAWVVAFRDQHADHARACNEIAGRLGGKSQTAQNPGLAQVLNRSRPNLGDLLASLDTLVDLETASVATYQNAVGLLGDLNARRLAASIMAVEAQHGAALQVARTLANARQLDLLTMDSGAAPKIPADTITVAFPDSFTNTDQARAAAEGAIR